MCAEVDPDWGRFFVLKSQSRHILYYGQRSHTFIHPLTIPLPKLIARALALCSGEAPLLSESSKIGQTQAVYRTVPQSIAAIAAQKLGQELNCFE